MQGLEAAFGDTFTGNGEGVHRLREAFEPGRAEVAEDEEAAQEVARALGENHGARLGQPRGCPAGSYDADLRVARGHDGSRLAHAALGLVGGAVAGGIIARVTAGDGCVIEGCDDGDLVVAIKTVIGVAAGGVIGAVVGALLPAGPRWLTETATRPVRVAGLELHPELRVSLDVRRGH